MITDLLSLILILLFLALGISRPYVALVGVIWVDLYQPQSMSQSFLAGRPLSFLMTAFFGLSVLLNMRKVYRPASWLYIVVMPLFMAWITLTTYHAEFPDSAWYKYDIAVKILLFSYFIPYVLGTRRELELFLWTLVASIGYFILTAGVKSVLSGGGYGVNLVSDSATIWWSEGSTLAAQAISLLPIFYYASRHSLLARDFKYLKLVLLGLSFASLMVLIGTAARTGLVALAALVVLAVAHSKSKIKSVIAIGVLALVVSPFMTDAWRSRMETMSDISEESSALGRVVVWRWTLDYVRQRPLMGGGFNAYLANAGQLANYSHDGEVVIDQEGGKAFHNILIEVLGEHGYVGLSIYLIIIGHTLWTSRRVYKRAPEEWQRWLGLCIFVSTAVYCVGGMFIGVAFYPWLYYMYGFAVAARMSMKPAAVVEPVATRWQRPVAPVRPPAVAFGAGVGVREARLSAWGGWRRNWGPVGRQA